MLLPGKKLVYFVRHGQSANNAANLRQGASGSLSDKGKAQARFVGERLQGAAIELVLASPFERAKETAGIANETFKCPIEYSDLLIERKNPSEIIGSFSIRIPTSLSNQPESEKNREFIAKITKAAFFVTL